MITVLFIPVLTAAKDHSIALKDVFMQAVWTALLHPLQSFIALLLTILPLILIYLDEANRPTYGFIGTFFRFALLTYIIVKTLLPVISVSSEDNDRNEEKIFRRRNPFAKMLSERKSKKYLL